MSNFIHCFDSSILLFIAVDFESRKIRINSNKIQTKQSVKYSLIF